MSAVSMPTLFRACAEVLTETLRPWRYSDLTIEAFRRLGFTASDHRLNDAKADVREKMLQAGQYGSAYTGAPDYLAVKRCWFYRCERELINAADEAVTVPGHATWAKDAFRDGVLLSRHLVTKVADNAARWEGLARGLMIERHVVNWFEAEWPRQFAPPDNEGKFVPCNHDFKLTFGGRVWEIDVMGTLRDGMYGMPLGDGALKKKPADFHVIARLCGRNVLIQGFTRGDRIEKLNGERFTEEQATPISWLTTRLEFEAQGWDWNTARRVLWRS